MLILIQNFEIVIVQANLRYGLLKAKGSTLSRHLSTKIELITTINYFTGIPSNAIPSAAALAAALTGQEQSFLDSYKMVGNNFPTDPASIYLGLNPTKIVSR